MSGDREDKIRKRAHELWEKAGRPEGDHLGHWHQASAEVDAEAPAPSAERVTGAGPALAKHTKDANVGNPATKTKAPKGPVDPQI